MKNRIKKASGSSRADTVLIRAVQAGDMAAFDELVLKHKDRLFNLVYWFLGDYQDANDCAQETFIKVFKSIKKFRLDRHFPPGFIGLPSIRVKTE